MRRGFSLVELSIVLVILGLLVGGILGGQSLIHAAELRTITTELAKYTTASNSFRIKYNTIPGDLTTAESLWGTDSEACPNTSYNGSIQTPKRATCNGNGDGKIVSGGMYELYRFWQHLSNAGLIESMHTGILSGIPEDVGKAKLSGASWSIPWPYDRTFRYSKNGYGDDLSILSPEDALFIDGKLDDAKPTTGSVLGSTDGDAVYNCDTAGNAYNLTETNIACRLDFLRAF